MSFPNWLEKKSSSLDFPLENLPYGIFSDSSRGSRPGVALGDHVIDLCALQMHGYFTGPILSKEPCFSEVQSRLFFMSMGKGAWSEARSTLQRLFDSNEGVIRDHPSLRQEILIPMESVEMHLPARIGDFTDFYASKEHATNIGSIVRDPKNPLASNWVHLPVAYHGRASSVVISGTDIPRPYGQVKDPQNDIPLFQPSSKVDYELEMGLFIGPGNPLGQPINIENAMDHAFGVVLLNDWSARDIQQWEAFPLGPFNSKNWGTTISPWIVPMEALEPFVCDPPIQDPPVLPYLSSTTHHKTFDIYLEAHVQAQNEGESELVSKSNFRNLYWTFPQMIAHHTITGCNLQPGDLLGTGTISSSTPQGQGCLLELSIKDPSRGFLKDGDTVTLKGWCEKSDGVRIGFGECKGQILENH